jgi:hypothetical protein
MPRGVVFKDCRILCAICSTEKTLVQDYPPQRNNIGFDANFNILLLQTV